MWVHSGQLAQNSLTLGMINGPLMGCSSIYVTYYSNWYRKFSNSAYQFGIYHCAVQAFDKNLGAVAADTVNISRPTFC